MPLETAAVNLLAAVCVWVCVCSNLKSMVFGNSKSIVAPYGCEIKRFVTDNPH